MRQPPTRKQVRACIDDADLSYRKCWQTLASLRKVELDGCGLFDFQPALASALFRLDHAYRGLVHHRSVLIQKKSSYSATRFRQRMRALDQDVKALRTAIDVGRNLGDAFAWTFYQYDQPSLERHFKHPANPHTPPGTGGRGELEFIRQTSPQGFLMLYHGITNFLRIGDVSFFDVSTGRISAIGELKSVLVEPGHLVVRLHTISNNRGKIPFFDAKHSPTRPADRDRVPPMDNRFEATLKRQMKKMAEVVRRSEPDQNADLKLAYHVDELAQFAKQLSLKQVAHQRVGKGGILVGCSPHRGQSLSSRIYSKASQASVVRQLRRTGAPVSTICNPALPDNSIFAAELDLGVNLGIPPLFWFPCDLDFLKKVYFMRVIVVTVYNPVHLLDALRKRGYEVRVEYQKTAPPKFEIGKKIPEGTAEVEGFDFFLRLVQHRFMREAKIMEGFEAVLDRVPEPVSGQSVRLGLSFVHHF